MAMSESVSPHMGRTLLIHNAKANDSVPRNIQGFGFCPEAMSDILECSDNRVTIMYSGIILPTQFLKLPVFAPRINEMHGNVSISWTIATVVAPYSNDPDAYTNNCLEDVFSPHSMVYSFTKRGIRVVPANKEIAGYLNIFLGSEYGYYLITRYTYGSVVDEIDDNHVRQIAIPLLKNKEVQKRINDLALEANEKRYEAYKLEQQALRIMDKEVIYAK